MNFIRIFGVGLVVLLWGFAGQAKVVEYKLVIAEGSVQVEGQTFTVRRLYHEATRPQLVGVARSVASVASKMDWTPDVVHLHVAYSAGSAAVAWAKKWGVPVVLTEHWTAYQDFGAVPWWRRRVIRDVVKRADAVCPVSADLREAMAAAVPGMGAMHVVPNVVDTARFKPAEDKTLAGVPVGATRRRLEGPSAPATLASRAVLAVASPFLVPWVARVGFMVCFGLGCSCFKMHNSSPASKSLQFVMVGTRTQPGFESPIL